MRQRVEYDLFADIYDVWVAGAPAVRDNLSFYVEEYVRTAGPVVELGVGNGRIAVEAARQGKAIVGVDSSVEMLRLCLERAKAAGVTDMLTLRVHRPCDRPRRAPLIVQRLDETGVMYRVGGGIVIALHGVPVPVKDLDLLTDADGAYRFQALFPDHVVEPVSLRESPVYRSHLGRFDFDGVTVEVMGDLHRREESGWVPAVTVTETTVDLDGVPIRVPWLEEETLFYIWRGRLERAALCLPYCDRDWLLVLLRGERPLES